MLNMFTEHSFPKTRGVLLWDKLVQRPLFGSLLTARGAGSDGGDRAGSGLLYFTSVLLYCVLNPCRRVNQMKHWTGIDQNLLWFTENPQKINY